MSAVHVHLLLNHAPVFGLIAVIFLFIWAAVRKSEEVNRVALVGLVLVALSTIPVYLTGEEAEEVAEHLAGVTHDSIEEHEDAGKFALISTLLSGAAALGALFWRTRSRMLSRVALILAIWAFTVVARTAWLGGADTAYGDSGRELGPGARLSQAPPQKHKCRMQNAEFRM